jgi:putative transposase
MEMRRDAHSVSELGYHLVWVTKYRHPVLDGAVGVVCKNIIAETCAAYGWDLKEIEVMPDHVHVFVQAGPSAAPSEIASTLKSISAVRVFYAYPSLKGRKFWGSGLWSPSTYYGSVGHISEDTVRRYIQTQKTRA